MLIVSRVSAQVFTGVGTRDRIIEEGLSCPKLNMASFHGKLFLERRMNKKLSQLHR